VLKECSRRYRDGARRSGAARPTSALRNIVRRFDQFGGLLSWTQASAAKARDVAAFTTTLDAASTSMEAAKEAAHELGTRALPTRERDESHGYEGSS